MLVSYITTKRRVGVTGCMAITIDTNLIIAGVDSIPPRLQSFQNICSYI